MMRKIALLAFLLPVFASGCGARPASVNPAAAPLGPAATPFGNPVVDWDSRRSPEKCPKEEVPGGEFYCQDGQRHIVSTQPQGIAAPDYLEAANFMAEVEMMPVGGQGAYGIAFGNRPGAAWVVDVFQVMPGGQYELVRMAAQPSMELALIPWTDSAAIHKGEATNTLKVLVQNKQITLFVNGQQLASVVDDQLAPGSVGPAATDQGHTVMTAGKFWELP
jgi:hypothetical protein